MICAAHKNEMEMFGLTFTECVLTIIKCWHWFEEVFKSLRLHTTEPATNQNANNETAPCNAHSFSDSNSANTKPTDKVNICNHKIKKFHTSWSQYNYLRCKFFTLTTTTFSPSLWLWSCTQPINKVDIKGREREGGGGGGGEGRGGRRKKGKKALISKPSSINLGSEVTVPSIREASFSSQLRAASKLQSGRKMSTLSPAAALLLTLCVQQDNPKLYQRTKQDSNQIHQQSEGMKFGWAVLNNRQGWVGEGCCRKGGRGQKVGGGGGLQEIIGKGTRWKPSPHKSVSFFFSSPPFLLFSHYTCRLWQISMQNRTPLCEVILPT